MNQRKAILYVRVSTDEQADKGHSLAHQEEKLRQYCIYNNIEVVGFYKEDHSAKTFERPQFKLLLEFLKKNKQASDTLLFLKWDRFSRNAPEAYGMISTLAKLGVEPQAAEQPLNLEVPEQKIMLALYLTAPEVENDRRAMNVFAGMRRAKKEGRYMGNAPYGYKHSRTEHNRPCIAPGKDADLVIWSDHPLSIYAKADQTIVDGIIYFDRNKDLHMRNQLVAERNRIIQKMLGEKRGGASVQPAQPSYQVLLSCGDHEHKDGLITIDGDEAF